ncbi:uncharacterized protein LOC132553129 [Ylistrum balloti]|uniref:uncharacterized protein LOC132553129 n=1 Tax=Ylistrum balloti TaxID=509963 RepID=UPI002905C2D3|nr:uncharacterized protein LOC132553129 [Ylistrum balloti]
MEELSDALPGIKSKLDLCITSMESKELPRVQRCIELTEQRLIDNAKHIKDIVCEMKSQGDKCKDEIDDMVDDCVSICDSLGKENTELLISYLAEHQKQLRELTDQIKRRRQALLTGSNVAMFDALCDVPNYETVDWPSLHTAQFSPCKVVKDLLKQALGQLTTSLDSKLLLLKNCRSTQERHVSNGVHERPTKEPQSTTDEKSTQKSTDRILVSQEPSIEIISTVLPPPQQPVGLRSGRHPPRPVSERGRGKSPSPPNRHHQRPPPRPYILKRRNSVEAPSSIHRFLTARPSTSSDIRPVITVKSSPQRRDTHATMSVSRRHNRRSMSLPLGQKPEPPSSDLSPSLLHAILSSSRDIEPNDSSPQKTELHCSEESSNIEPQIHIVPSQNCEWQVTEGISQSSGNQLPTSYHEPETSEVSPPQPERRTQSQRTVHHPVILSQFPSPCAVTSICLTSDGHAWTCNEESRVLTQLDNAGDVIKTVSCKANVNDISMSNKTHHLWYCTWKCRVVELDPETDTRIRRFTTEIWPRCVCVTDKEEILVGAEKKITLYTTDGSVIMTTDTEMSGVIRPTRLTQCPLTGNIAFLEKSSSRCDGQDNGHVVVLSNDLSVKFRYTGDCDTSQSVESSYFDPFDIKYDDKGCLLVGDFTSNTVDLITGTGNHSRTLLTDTGSSQAIGIHTDGVIWAAFKNDKDVSHVKILRY